MQISFPPDETVIRATRLRKLVPPLLAACRTWCCFDGPIEIRQHASRFIEKCATGIRKFETWLKQAADKLAGSSAPPVGLRQFLGSDAAQMTTNQVRNLTDRRIRTVTCICRS